MKLFTLFISQACLVRVRSGGEIYTQLNAMSELALHNTGSRITELQNLESCTLRMPGNHWTEKRSHNPQERASLTPEIALDLHRYDRFFN